MFMDATHPQHNPVIACGWIKRGKEHPIKSNTGRRRLNINGVIDVQRMSAEIRFDDTISSNVFGNSSRAKCFTTATLRRSMTIETLASAFSVNSIHMYRSYARC